MNEHQLLTINPEVMKFIEIDESYQTCPKNKSFSSSVAYWTKLIDQSFLPLNCYNNPHGHLVLEFSQVEKRMLSLFEWVGI